MAARRRSASRNTPIDAGRVIRRRRRGTLQEEGGRGRSPPNATRLLLGRLRRLELAMAYSLSGKPRDFDLDKFLEAVLQLNTDATTSSGRSIDEGGELQVPQEGGAPGEAQRATRVDRGPARRHGLRWTETESTKKEPDYDGEA